MKEILDEQEQREYIMKKVGGKVTFVYPDLGNDMNIGNVKHVERMENGKLVKKIVVEGKLLDRFTANLFEDQNVVVWGVVDQIKFDNSDEEAFRMTYYRYIKGNRWVFAGQTSFTFGVSQVRKFFIDAIRGFPWFKDLFEEIFANCSNELE